MSVPGWRAAGCTCGLVSSGRATTLSAVNPKHEKIAALAAPFAGQRQDARYLAWFDCFNRGLYFEAHEVLEELWLPVRGEPVGDFFKGLIQLAGAFVHVQKGRAGPAVALLNLADANLGRFPNWHEGFPVWQVRTQIARWRAAVAETPVALQGLLDAPPQLQLLPAIPPTPTP
jgi:hypothetical protein